MRNAHELNELYKKQNNSCKFVKFVGEKIRS